MRDLSRRRLMQLMSGIALVAPDILTRMAAASSLPAGVSLLHLERNGWVPNNSKLPVIIYKNALNISNDTTHTAETQFEMNNWPPQWVAGIFDYHHYHSSAHEVLGCVSGNANVMLGGPGGHVVSLSAGDVALLPTGTGHCNQNSSDDFLVVGAYPPGQHWDICRTAPTAEMTQRMRRLPFPDSDPVSGRKGPLANLWQKRSG